MRLPQPRCRSALSSDGEVEALFEICEQRLVLSAQALVEILGTNPLDPGGFSDPYTGNGCSSTIALQPHANDTNALTGLDIVQQQFGLSGAGQTVAVIDSGITWNHVALGNGYGPGYRVVGGWDFAENDDRPYDDGPAGFHGTHVSGIIGSDDQRALGVAPEVDLVALRVFNDAGQGQLDWVESALQWVHENRDAFENPITTVNISIGTLWNSEDVPNWGILEDELKQLYDEGILVTASAGNSFTQYHTTGLSYPASSHYVLPVASVNAEGQLSDFSQRSDRVIGAPGERILSTVPDHLLGRDGKFDDFSTASGTSMASPYVAGASVLVRQAMEMTGWEAINAEVITDHLRTTADRVFDSITGQSYDRLNLAHAIESILPTDMVGDDSASAATVRLDSQLETWINQIGDVDVYRFNAEADGTLTARAASDWVDSVHWAITSGGKEIASGDYDARDVRLLAGRQYELWISADDGIGPVTMDFDFRESPSHQNPGQDTGSGLPSGQVNADSVIVTDLGRVDYLESRLAAGTAYSVKSAQDGLFTVQWSHPDSEAGSLTVSDASGHVRTASQWVAGGLRLDIPVKAGDELEIRLPALSSSGQTSASPAEMGELTLANVLERVGSSVTLTGTFGKDSIATDLSHGLEIAFGKVDYVFPQGQITKLQIAGQGNLDELDVTGSSQIERVNLSPTGSTIENGGLTISIAGVENVSFESGGGTDRVYLYDSDTDDILRASPGAAELVGVGYRFSVSDVERIFIHATGGGQDYAYLYDSPGDDRLSARPQFTSFSGDRFFNYVRGFERIYAYANLGGHDVAELYDSAQADRFITSGVSASMVGPGFSSYTRSFEEVNAYATAGGNDLATLYGADGRTHWQQGSDFVSFQESEWKREARGFEDVATFQNGQAFLMKPQAMTDEPEWPIGVDVQTAPQTESGNWIKYLTHTSDSLEQEPPTVSTGSGPAMLARELLATRLHLPEEPILQDVKLEQDVLDEAFRQFEAMFQV